jgi:hypothetical protein
MTNLEFNIRVALGVTKIVLYHLFAMWMGFITTIAVIAPEKIINLFR